MALSLPLVAPGPHIKRTAVLHGLVLSGLIFLAYLFLVLAPQKGTMGFDAVAYWTVNLADLYRGSEGDLGFFPYSPAAAVAFMPLTFLSWPAFALVWWGLLMTVLAWLGGRSLLVLLAFPPVAIELYHGNIHLLLAAVVVLGFRYPAVWAFALLTKVTVGLGLLWFAARREWRQMLIALGATGLVAAISFAILPSQWSEWMAILTENAGHIEEWPALPIPLAIRLPIAAALILWGARRNARWTVPVGVTLSLPVLWVGGFSLLVACWPLRGRAGAGSVATS